MVRVGRAENFFIVKPDCARRLFTNGAQNKFRFRNFEPAHQLFYLDAVAYTIAISMIRPGELSAAQPRAPALAFL